MSELETSDIPDLTATYRVQLNTGFTLGDALAIVPYLDRLGISHLYCSPILAARPGSTHGYDVIDPSRVNPEIGTEEDLRALADALHQRGMGMLVDIVPNHMGIGPANPYWEDVLTHGRSSRYAAWFDMDWEAGGDKVVLPVLADDVATVLARDGIVLDLKERTPRLRAGESSWPVDPASLPEELELAKLDPTAVADPNVFFHGRSGHQRMLTLLDAQHYTLLGWREGAARINYRRFFDVSDLIGLRQEDHGVFDATHGYLLRLVREGVVDGLRVDHVDGLRDPLGYLTRLRSAVTEVRGAIPIVVEKIISPGERLRAGWPVEGTTGYEFMNDVEDLFLAPGGFAEIDGWYRRRRRVPADGNAFADIAHATQLHILETSLRPDVCRLVRVAAEVPALADIPRAVLERGIVRLIASLPVYRTYADPRTAGLHPDDAAVLARAVADAERRLGDDGAGKEAVRAVAATIAAPPDATREEFVARFQQTSGPATAKGVEDTALYVYVPLASRNEVGGAPDRPLATAVERFHAGNAERARAWPRSLLATNTHDTKRSADVRARLDVLTELPAEWRRHVVRWRRLNHRHRETVAGRIVPDGNAEYLLYQTLVGIWPAPRPGRRADDLPDRAWREAARGRLVQYMRKAVREAKLHTTWTEPNTEYEAALERFIGKMMEPAEDAPFLSDVARFVARIAPAGQRNALSRVLLHLTSPGVPDTYRGDELWFVALVDPDNRGPVDFAVRESALGNRESGTASNPASHYPNPVPLPDTTKIEVLRRLLNNRRAHSALFGRGSYLPLEVRGRRAGHVVAFARVHGEEIAVVAASRFHIAMSDDTAAEAGWGDTALVLPPSLGGKRFRSGLAADGGALLEAGSEFTASELFAGDSIAIWLSS